ncbi:NAD-dependent protein deacetylase [Spirochaetota bacterium]|nr:NAD-dependent protein deacetylase [Spirochaetota bacterium]
MVLSQSKEPIASEVFEEIVKILHKETTKRILFITGAGISVASGLPTYRGVGGLYNETETADDLPIEEILSAHVMKDNPALAWKYLYEMENFLRSKQPNAAHKTIAKFEQFFQTIVLTQNIDAFHRKAGSSAVVEIHGTMHKLVCTGATCDWEAEVRDFTHLPALPQLPLCSVCGKLIRPNVVLFGEALPKQALLVLHQHYGEPFDVVFSIGTTSYFPYIQAPVHRAKAARALTIEINPIPTIISDVFDYSLRIEADTFLVALWENYLRRLKT